MLGEIMVLMQWLHTVTIQSQRETFNALRPSCACYDKKGVYFLN